MSSNDQLERLQEGSEMPILRQRVEMVEASIADVEQITMAAEASPVSPQTISRIAQIDAHFSPNPLGPYGDN